jgi:hypothetical protein
MLQITISLWVFVFSALTVGVVALLIGMHVGSKIVEKAYMQDREQDKKNEEIASREPEVDKVPVVGEKFLDGSVVEASQSTTIRGKEGDRTYEGLLIKSPTDKYRIKVYMNGFALNNAKENIRYRDFPEEFASIVNVNEYRILKDRSFGGAE